MIPIRQAVKEDLPQVAQIYDEVLEYQATHTNYTNWKKGLYPTPEVARQALEAGTLYVSEDENGLTGCIILNHVQPPEYAQLDWTVSAAGSEVLVIHTLCIRPGCARRGLGRRYVAFSLELAKSLGCKAVRLDTYEKNQPAAQLYSGMGFTFVGSAPFHFQNVIWETLICFEIAVK